MSHTEDKKLAVSATPGAGVASSALITTPEEARAYYESHLAGLHKVHCRERDVKIVFQAGGTHLYSKNGDIAQAPPAMIVRRPVHRGFDDRVFCLERAHLMDDVLPTISTYLFSLPGKGRQPNRQLYSAKLPSGVFLCVILDGGPGDAWTCLTAYPVNAKQWTDAQRSKRAKFPP